MMEEEVLNSKSTLRTWLFNPFYFVAGGEALGIGLVIMFAAAANGALSDSHFDGVLDFHSGAPAPLWVFPIEVLVDWLNLGLFLWVAGLAISKSHIRAVDVFGTQALARTPTLAMAAAAMLPGFQEQTERLKQMNFEMVPADTAQFAFVGFIVIVMLIWMIYLMYRAFAVSCNVKGIAAVGVFIVALLLAEISSKIIIVTLLTTVLK
jgi:hypothetical protein